MERPELPRARAALDAARVARRQSLRVFIGLATCGIIASKTHDFRYRPREPASHARPRASHDPATSAPSVVGMQHGNANGGLPTGVTIGRRRLRCRVHSSQILRLYRYYRNYRCYWYYSVQWGALLHFSKQHVFTHDLCSSVKALSTPAAYSMVYWWLCRCAA